MEGKQWTGVGVRKTFLEYFEKKGHKIGALADSHHALQASSRPSNNGIEC